MSPAGFKEKCEKDSHDAGLSFQINIQRPRQWCPPGPGRSLAERSFGDFGGCKRGQALGLGRSESLFGDQSAEDPIDAGCARFGVAQGAAWENRQGGKREELRVVGLREWHCEQGQAGGFDAVASGTVIRPGQVEVQNRGVIEAQIETNVDEGCRKPGLAGREAGCRACERIPGEGRSYRGQLRGAAKEVGIVAGDDSLAQKARKGGRRAGWNADEFGGEAICPSERAVA